MLIPMWRRQKRDQIPNQKRGLGNRVVNSWWYTWRYETMPRLSVTDFRPLPVPQTRSIISRPPCFAYAWRYGAELFSRQRNDFRVNVCPPRCDFRCDPDNKHDHMRCAHSGL
jgi:hypothetical protein